MRKLGKLHSSTFNWLLSFVDWSTKKAEMKAQEQDFELLLMQAEEKLSHSNNLWHKIEDNSKQLVLLSAFFEKHKAKKTQSENMIKMIRAKQEHLDIFKAELGPLINKWKEKLC